MLAEIVHVLTDQKRFTQPLTMGAALERARMWLTATEVTQVFPTDAAGRGNDDRRGSGGLRSLAAVAGHQSTPFHGADRADALQPFAECESRYWQMAFECPPAFLRELSSGTPS
jgi:hypothetical protein